jgi:transcriptional regulator with XRE-family HTH domain
LLKNNFYIAQSLKKLRDVHVLSKKELAKRLNIPSSTYSKYEIELFRPSLDKLIRLARYFGVSCDYLLFCNKTSYPHHIRLLALAQTIDKAGAKKVNQIKADLNALISLTGQKQKNYIKEDSVKLPFIEDVSKNILLYIKNKGVMKKEIANYLEVTPAQITHYTKSESVPSYENLVKLSKFFDCSVHFLVTGEALHFDFDDKDFGQTILLADHFLPLEDHQILIRLMEAVLINP